MRFLVTSCLHLRATTCEEKLRQIGKELAAASVGGIETVVLDGDICDDGVMWQWIKGALAAFKNVIYVPGNHDSSVHIDTWINLAPGHATVEGVKFFGFTGYNYGDHCWSTNSPGSVYTTPPHWATAHRTIHADDIRWELDDLKTSILRYQPDVLITHYPFAYVKNGLSTLEVAPLTTACKGVKRVLFGHAHNTANDQFPLSLPGMADWGFIDNICAVNTNRSLFTEVVV